jgi:SAM-dependent methyltransferase
MTILTMAIADAIAIAALCTLYMVRHRNRELMISYAVINAGIFTVSVALVSAGSNASAMGMGLFGVLSIIRLRSTALSQREVGYYFVALSVGMIAGVNISPAYIAFGLMATLVGLIAILDSRSAPVSTNQTQTVTADRAISDEEELKAYLSTRLGYTVTSAKITELDMVNNLTRATVTYQPKEPTEGGTPAAVEAAQPVAAQAVAPQITATRQPVAPTAEAHATLETQMIPLQRTPVGK